MESLLRERQDTTPVYLRNRRTHANSQNRGLVCIAGDTGPGGEVAAGIVNKMSVV